ncbi:hypothetical protein GCM10025864_28830 [Luteimicrobium album]|uniref:Probable membrane transporter protein n=1 Tax=Luteimicrobium album TaxID=1054550 RepID=A0ABQ6I590_9MICO|nr:sulfite exporter TauE/SafE family protein [Luteimicrobium album]GMA25124.1 hypothetical protein GCM10025864_28830 [Luteimicrobium album]
MSVDPALVLGGLVVGFVVGLTGMGGGALMTPMLIFVFKVDPLMAVSSDVVASLFMKPAGAVVHLRRRTVNLRLVGWLCLGSVPAAFSGVLLLRVLPLGDGFDDAVKVVLGVALLLASAGLVVRAVLQMTRRSTPFGEGPAEPSSPDVVVRPVPTVALGAVAGLLVGMTSVGAGSIVIVILLLMYPALQASQVVGTDLVQAVPLVAAASLGHLLYGDFSSASRRRCSSARSPAPGSARTSPAARPAGSSGGRWRSCSSPPGSGSSGCRSGGSQARPWSHSSWGTWCG